VLNIIKKEANNLVKYRHPKILSIVENCLEDKSSVGFVTERVVSNLQSYIDQKKLDELFPSELEIKCNLIDLVDGLSFLHSDVKIAHLGINPSSIYVTEDGRWKLGGFVFNLQLLKDPVGSPIFDFFNPNLYVKLNPDLKFSAPETAKQPI
jgi:SCY1-like protein 2